MLQKKRDFRNCIDYFPRSEIRRVQGGTAVDDKHQEIALITFKGPLLNEITSENFNTLV